MEEMAAAPDIEEQLRAAIRAAPLTPYRIAEQAGVNRSVLTRFLNGERSMTLENAAKVAKVLGLQLTAIAPPK